MALIMKVRELQNLMTFKGMIYREYCTILTTVLKDHNYKFYHEPDPEPKIGLKVLVTRIIYKML